MVSVRGIEMTDIQKKIQRLAKKYRLQIIYAFGSRAQEILAMSEGKGMTCHLPDLTWTSALYRKQP